MSGFLLDSCVLSEFKKPRPNAGLYAWLTTVDVLRTMLSAITIGELRYGIRLLAASAKRRELERWLISDVVTDFAGRILPFDSDTADRWGAIRADARAKGHTVPPIDAMLAATAHQHNLTIVTRNETHFLDANAMVLNPWDPD